MGRLFKFLNTGYSGWIINNNFGIFITGAIMRNRTIDFFLWAKIFDAIEHIAGAVYKISKMYWRHGES